MDQVTAFTCRFWRNCSFACKSSKSQKWKSVLIVKSTTWETKCQKIYITGHGKESPFQLWWLDVCVIPPFDITCLLPTGSSDWKFRNVDTLCGYCAQCAFFPHQRCPAAHGAIPNSKNWFTTSFLQRKMPESDARSVGLFVASDRDKRRVEWHVSRSRDIIGLYIVYEVKYLIHCIMSRSIRIEFCWRTLSLRSLLEWNIT